MIPEARAAPGPWVSRGACQAEDPELFFPITVTGPAIRQIGLAKAVCGRCDVRGPCLSYAMATHPDGIWGGTTPEDRTAMRVTQAVTPPPARRPTEA